MTPEEYHARYMLMDGDSLKSVKGSIQFNQLNFS
jgi:hypothetical protein